MQAFSFLFGLLFIPMMYLFARNQIFKKQVFRYLFIISIIFSVIALFQINQSVTSKPNFYLFLFCPLYDLALLYPLLLIFNKIKKRNPKNAGKQFFPNDDGLWSDRFFDSIILTLWIIIPYSLLAYFYT
jgi:hypothetical protein